MPSGVRRPPLLFFLQSVGVMCMTDAKKSSRKNDDVDIDKLFDAAEGSAVRITSLLLRSCPVLKLNNRKLCIAYINSRFNGQVNNNNKNDCD